MADTWIESESEWKGIPEGKRRLWFGIATEGMTAPWLSAFGACFVKIWDIRIVDGIVEYGIGNESPPVLGWVKAGDFYSEWPD